MLFYLSMFTHGVLVYPLPIFQYSYLPWLLLVFLFYSAKRRFRPEGLASNSLLWLSASFLFFWILVKSQAELHYSIWLQPPLAIFTAVSLAGLRRRSR